MRSLVCVLLVATVTLCVAGSPLNDYIRHYEPLQYNTEDIHENHLRVKRSEEQHVRLRFQSHEKDFLLKLKQDTSTFSRDHHFQSGGKLEKRDTSFIYSGELENVPNSKAFGSIINGRFAGTIITPEETYYVEKREYHFNKPQKFHSVIYASDDVIIDPYRGNHTCAHSIENIQSKMEAETKSVIKSSWFSKFGSPIEKQRRHNIYARDANKEKRTCPLYLQTDTLLWDYINGTLQYKADKSQIHEEITAMLASHVQAIRRVFEGTTFANKDESYNGITFVIQRTRINSTEDCTGNQKQSNPFCATNLDVTAFLNANSYQNHDLFCLAYVFTYRDFMGGTLGLAWVGSSTSQAGGICEKHRQIRDDRGNIVSKSTNSGIVTLVNYNKPVPPKVSHITFAHEAGHNFGSPHDPDKCQPYTSTKDSNGNYIMFASATSGARLNNNKFSSCSINSISEVLHAVMNEKNGKENCFKTDTAEFCGNGVREGDEECDCGFEDDCQDKCCWSRVKDRPESESCKRKQNVTCSPGEGSCCDSDCNFKPNPNAPPCSYSTDCTEHSYCTGNNATCPIPEFKVDGTPCNENTQICKQGECTGTLCSKITSANGTDSNGIIRWEDCSYKSDNITLMCYLSCKKPNSEICWNSGSANDIKFPAEFKELLNNLTPGAPIPLQAGEPCDHLQGYCDAFKKCRSINVKGPLARLKEALLSLSPIAIISWMQQYWWAVALIILGAIVSMGLFIKICSVHTPSTNPKLRKARKLSRPTLPRHNNRTRHIEDRSSGQAGNRGMSNPQINQKPRGKNRDSDRDRRKPPPAYGEVMGQDNRYFLEMQRKNQRV